jgi:plasmid maintenance system killer protein
VLQPRRISIEQPFIRLLIKFLLICLNKFRTLNFTIKIVSPSIYNLKGYIFVMIIEFDNDDLYLFYLGTFKGKPKFPMVLQNQFRKVVSLFQNTSTFSEIKKINSLRIHPLKNDLEGYFAARVNDQYRIIFELSVEENGKEIIEIIIIEDLTDYH